jgi:hypothetical protein
VRGVGFSGWISLWNAQRIHLRYKQTSTGIERIGVAQFHDFSLRGSDYTVAQCALLRSSVWSNLRPTRSRCAFKCIEA